MSASQAENYADKEISENDFDYSQCYFYSYMHKRPSSSTEVVGQETHEKLSFKRVPLAPILWLNSSKDLSWQGFVRGKGSKRDLAELDETIEKLKSESSFAERYAQANQKINAEEIEETETLPDWMSRVINPRPRKQFFIKAAKKELRAQDLAVPHLMQESVSVDCKFPHDKKKIEMFYVVVPAELKHDFESLLSSKYVVPKQECKPIGNSVVYGLTNSQSRELNLEQKMPKVSGVFEAMQKTGQIEQVANQGQIKR